MRQARSANEVSFWRAFGARVCKLRQRREWSQLALAHSMDPPYTCQWMSRVELGRTALTLRQARMLADALGVALAELEPRDGAPGLG